MRADRAFRDLLLAALAVMATLALPLVITLFPGALQRALHGYDALAEVCALALYRLGGELPHLGAVVLAIASAVVLAGAARAVRTISRTRAALRSRRRLPLTRRLATAAARVGVASRTVCFEDLRPIAYCAGVLRPMVWISTGATERLEDDELEAVLWHESYHLRHRDPWRILIAQILREMLFLFPLVRSLVSRFEVAKELDADREALRAQGSAAPLAGALTTLGRSAPPLVPADLAIGAWSTSTARVDQLCGASEEFLLAPVSACARVGTGLAVAVLLLLAGGQAARANVVPAVVVQIVAPAATEIHECPLPIDGILF